MLATATAIVTAAGFAAPASANQREIPPTRQGASAADRAVTLITGDRVVVHPSGTFNVHRGPGRTNVDFETSRVAGHLNVIPTDAIAQVDAGRIDARLFDVTELLRQGFDEHRTDLPLIVGTEATPAAVAAARATVSTDAATQVQSLPQVAAVTVHEQLAQAGDFWHDLTVQQEQGRTLKPQLKHLWLDGKRHPLLDRSVPQIGAPAAWQAGYTGKDVTVAVLDSGVDATHPDLAPRVAATKVFTGDPDARDEVGHGTHVASTIVGTGAASDGKYRGVAPDARLVVGKVCSDRDCSDSTILAGMQWAASEEHARVVNISLGEDDSPGLDPLEQAVETLTADYGTLFVIAAGNAGQDGSIGTPASAPSALTVGAIDKAGRLAAFSSRGPVVETETLKPDVTAPGVNITAALSKDAGGTDTERYTEMSGTSMAAPHVAGAATLLAQQHPDWKAGQLKAALMASAVPDPSVDVFAQGAGAIDVARAIKTTLTSEPTSVSFGRQVYPHGDDAPITRTVTYRNAADAPVQLQLAADGGIAADTLGPTAPAPAGMFTVEPSTLTVPAGGTATATLTADTSVAGPDGYAGGMLTATDGTTVTRTPFAIDREVESYDLTLKHLDRSGNATDKYVTRLISPDGKHNRRAYRSPDGTVRMRLPKGNYVLSSMLYADDPKQPSLTLLVQPLLNLTADQSVTIDARTAKPVDVDLTVPEGTPIPASATAGLIQYDSTGHELFGIGVTSERSTLFTGQIGPVDQPAPGFVTTVDMAFGDTPGKTTADGDTDEVSGERFAVNLAWPTVGYMPAGAVHHLTPADLARVETTNASMMSTSETGGSIGWAGGIVALPGVGRIDSFAVRCTLPGKRVEYYNTDNDILWSLALEEGRPDKDAYAYTIGRQARFEAGTTYQVNRNFAVFGPTVAMGKVADNGGWRDRDTIIVDVPMFGDGAGSMGFSAYSKREMTLSTGGKPIAADPADRYAFPVPAEADRYQMRVSMQRDPIFALSTKVTAEWGFRSGHVETATALPLWTIGFNPPFSLTNTVPAGQVLNVPVRVESQPQAEVGQLGPVTVEASYDDGATWQATPVSVGADDQRQIALDLPTGSGNVSLRASAEDSAGNTVAETIEHALRYGPAAG